MTDAEHDQIFRDWLHQYKGVLFKVVRTYAVTVMDKDDLFQEISLQVWRSVPSFRNESAVTTWLYRIALNTAIKWTQKEKKHQSETLDNATHILQENNHVSDERLDWLYGEIHQLDKVDRSLALLLLEGFSYKEMSAMLGITESNVGVKINRIKKQLIIKSKKHNHGI